MWGSSKSGFGASTTAEQVTEGIDASKLTVIITGATSGIGTETARVLALRGAHVYIGGRNVQSATSTKENILKELPNAKVDILAPLDLNSQASIRKSAESFLALDKPLNLLINNAGIMLAPYVLTEDGIESHFGINHIVGSNFRVCTDVTHLVPAISYASKAVVQWDNVNEEKGYNSVKAYAASKIANIYHAQELSRRLQQEGVTNVTINALHPGIIRTNLVRHIHGFYMGLFRAFYYVTRFIWKTIPQGAATTCYVALHPSLEGVCGKFYNDCNEFKVTKWNSLTEDAETARKLWDVQRQIVGPEPVITFTGKCSAAKV